MAKEKTMAKETKKKSVLSLKEKRKRKQEKRMMER